MSKKVMVDAKCIHCGKVRKVPWEKYDRGEVIMPYPGGGNYGRCLSCKREGLEIQNVPKVEIKIPVGWRNIRGQNGDY